MGDETVEFASRFSRAVSELTLLAAEPAAGRRRAQGPELARSVRNALDAIAAVYETQTEAVRNWPEQRRRVLARCAAMREALERSGADGELRQMARALVELIGPRSGGR